MGLLLKNNARSILSAAISSTDNSIRVRVGHGGRFPLPKKAGDWFPLTLEDENGNIEIVHATARVGDLITVRRGAEGTQALAYLAGVSVELRATAAVFQGGGSGGGGEEATISVSISDGKVG